MLLSVFFFQAEDGIRDLVRSRGLGDVYKRQVVSLPSKSFAAACTPGIPCTGYDVNTDTTAGTDPCLLYTSDAADERSSVDLGGRRIIKKNSARNKIRRV